MQQTSFLVKSQHSKRQFNCVPLTTQEIKVQLRKLLSQSKSYSGFIHNTINAVQQNQHNTQCLLKYVQSLPCSDVRINKIYLEQQKLIKVSYLQSIKWIKLKNLVLFDCKITTIEAISFMDMPCLVQLDISKNNIVCLKPLAKTNLTKITKLIISFNSFHIPCRMKCPKLYCLSIDRVWNQFKSLYQYLVKMEHVQQFKRYCIDGKSILKYLIVPKY